VRVRALQEGMSVRVRKLMPGPELRLPGDITVVLTLSLDGSSRAVYFSIAARLLWSRVKCGGGSPHFFVLDDFLDGM
jgi:hypothetical protein